MAEANQQKEKILPPGVQSSELYRDHFELDSTTLPWLHEPYDVSIVRCVVSDDTNYLLASAVGSHRKLEEAANGLTPHQSGVVNNMFYSRLAAFAQHGNAVSTIDTLPNPATPFPIRVMRNQGGQRAYFGVPLLPVGESGALLPVVLRLGVCDKNKQTLVMPVLADVTSGALRAKISKLR